MSIYSAIQARLTDSLDYCPIETAIYSNAAPENSPLPLTIFSVTDTQRRLLLTGEPLGIVKYTIEVHHWASDSSTTAASKIEQLVDWTHSYLHGWKEGIILLCQAEGEYRDTDEYGDHSVQSFSLMVSE